MQHDAVFQNGLHCLLRLETFMDRNTSCNLENCICDPSKYTMVSAIIIVSICTGKSIRTQTG